MTRRGLGGRHRARAPARSGQINRVSGEWTDWSGIAAQKDTGPKYHSPIPVSEWPLRPERVCASIEAPAACSEREDSRTKGTKSMSVKLTTREMGDVIIVDTSGKLTLGEGHQHPAHQDSGTGGRRFPANRSEPGRRHLHGQLWPRRTGSRAYHCHHGRGADEAFEPRQTRARSSEAHQVVHSFRGV